MNDPLKEAVQDALNNADLKLHQNAHNTPPHLLERLGKVEHEYDLELMFFLSVEKLQILFPEISTHSIELLANLDLERTEVNRRSRPANLVAAFQQNVEFAKKRHDLRSGLTELQQAILRLEYFSLTDPRR